MRHKMLPVSFLLLLLSTPIYAMGKKPPEPTSTHSAAPQTLNLQECFALALKRSETVAIQKENIEIAEAQIFKATSEALGDADFIMTNTQQEVPKAGGSEGGSSVTSTFNAAERRERKFVISQPLFQGFKSLGALTGAGSLTRQRKEEWRRAKELLFLDVVKAFYDYLRQQKDVAAIQEINILFQERIDELVERSKIGRSRESEVATAKTRMKIHEADLERSKGALEVARMTLEFLTGISLTNTELKDPAVIAQSEQTLESLLSATGERSDVQAAEEEMKTAKRAILVAQSGFWPSISLEHTQYEMREGFQAGIDWDLLFKINVPLFHGGENISKFKESVSKWKQAKHSLSLAERKAELDVKQSYQDWVSSQKESQALAEAVKASEENYKLQKEDYTRNLVSNLDVLQALESLLDTSRDANRIFYDTKINFWELQVASGNCCEAL